MLYRDNFDICNNGRRVALLTVTEDGLGQDADLRINAGPNKGVWRFRAKDGDTINIGHFETENGKITCDCENLQYLEIWKDCKSDCFSRNGGRIKNGKKYPIKKVGDNILVSINSNDFYGPNASWIPLEQFAAMR